MIESGSEVYRRNAFTGELCRRYKVISIGTVLATLECLTAPWYGDRIRVHVDELNSANYVQVLTQQNL